MAVASSALSLGEVLVRDGMISADQLQSAIQTQRTNSHSIGRVLVEQGFITEAVRTQAFRKDFGFGEVDLESEKPDPVLSALVPGSFAYKHRILPIRQEGDNTLVVAMEDPSDLMVLDAVKSQTGMNLKAYVAGSEQIADTISKIYAAQAASGGGAAPLAVSGGRGAGYKLLSALFLPVLVFGPAVLAAYLIWNVEEIQSTLKDFSRFSVGLYTLLGWGVWAIIIFYVNDLLFPAEKKPERETA